MKKLACLMILGAAACTDGGLGCDLSQYDAFVGQNVDALQGGVTGDFVIIESGEVWTPGQTGGQTIVFLDADRNIVSFGCG